MSRFVRLVALAVVLVTTSTGCLRVELGVTIDDDRSGEVVLDIYIDEEALRTSGFDATDLQRGVEAAAGAVDGIDVELVRAPGEQGIRMRVPFDDYRHLTSALINANALNQPLRIFRSFDVTEGPDGRWTLRSEIDPSGFSDVMREIPGALSGVGVEPGGLDPGGFDPDSLDLVLSVTLPGVVVSSNSTDVDGGTASWRLTGRDGATTMSMATVPAPFDWQRWVLVGVAVVGFGLLVVLLRRRGRRRSGRGDRAGGSGPAHVDAVLPANPWAAPASEASGSAGPWAPPPSAPAPWGGRTPSTPPWSEGPPLPVGGWAAPGSPLPGPPAPGPPAPGPPAPGSALPGPDERGSDL